MYSSPYTITITPQWPLVVQYTRTCINDQGKNRERKRRRSEASTRNPESDESRAAKKKRRMNDVVWLVRAQRYTRGQTESRSIDMYTPGKKPQLCSKANSYGTGGLSGTAGTSGVRAVPPGLFPFRFCCCRSRCSCSACIVAKICNCCAIKSDVFDLKGGEHQHKTSMMRVRTQDIPHSENSQGGFSATDVFLLFLLSFAILDRPEVPLRIHALCPLLDGR